MQDTVGSFELVRRIGSGGSGEVWLGRHTVSRVLGAVKRLNPRAGRRDAVVACFAREARAVARLGHPHIVPLFELGDDYVITAFVDGPNLQRRLQTSIDPATAVRITRQIAAALAHAHERGVVHRDVKPANILIDPRGNAYLADFGIAAIAGEENVEGPGRIAGTLPFMAPEQRWPGPVGPAADQYALGRTLMEMLAGGRLPDAAGEAVAALPASLPDALRAALARATAVDPEARFRTIAEFADALAAVDLSACGAPVLRAPAVRPAAPFQWCAAAERVVDYGADLARADYRVSALAGHLPERLIRHFLDTYGLADFGFSVWGSTAQLGALTDRDAYARVAEVVVLLHAWADTRSNWRAVAQALCRDNARALVLTPDVHGFGETRFAGVPTPQQAAMPTLARCVLAWRRLIGLHTTPTVLVGHSMSAIALLSIDQSECGAHVARVAVNPVLASHDRVLRLQFLAGALLSWAIARWPRLHKQILMAMATRSPATRHLAPEINEATVEQVLRMPPRAMASVMWALGTPPRRIGRQRRLAVVTCVDDPLVDREVLADAIGDLGLRAADILTLPSGGHLPHIEQAAHPEHTAGNVAALVHLIDSMMLTALEATRSVAVSEPTLPSEPTELA